MSHCTQAEAITHAREPGSQLVTHRAPTPRELQRAQPGTRHLQGVGARGRGIGTGTNPSLRASQAPQHARHPHPWQRGEHRWHPRVTLPPGVSPQPGFPSLRPPEGARAACAGEADELLITGAAWLLQRVSAARLAEPCGG